MKELPGIYAEISRNDVLNMNINFITNIINTQARLTAKHGRLHFIEFIVSGYDEDVRPIYEIPEIVTWIKHLHSELHGEFPFWLTPQSKMFYYLSMIPYKKQSDGSIELSNSQMEKIKDIDVMSAMSAYNRLRAAGMTMSIDVMNRLTADAAQNSRDALAGKLFGTDYIVSMSQIVSTQQKKWWQFWK